MHVVFLSVYIYLSGCTHFVIEIHTNIVIGFSQQRKYYRKYIDLSELNPVPFLIPFTQSLANYDYKLSRKNPIETDEGSHKLKPVILLHLMYNLH